MKRLIYFLPIIFLSSCDIVEFPLETPTGPGMTGTWDVQAERRGVTQGSLLFMLESDVSSGDSTGLKATFIFRGDTVKMTGALYKSSAFRLAKYRGFFFCVIPGRCLWEDYQIHGTLSSQRESFSGTLLLATYTDQGTLVVPSASYRLSGTKRQ